jgi:hypothetical protein
MGKQSGFPNIGAADVVDVLINKVKILKGSPSRKSGRLARLIFATLITAKDICHGAFIM